jgi:hypothetical protein
MSVMAVGPALDLDGPLPVAPEFGLLSIPGVIKSDDAGRQLNGVVVDAYPTDVPVPWEPCSTGTFREKEEGEAPPLPRFDPVGLYVPITCSAISFGRDWRAWASRAEKVLDATLSYGVEFVLSKGVDLSSNPFFGDGNVTVLGGGAVLPQAALSWLENSIGATGRRGIIHADNATVAAWSEYLRVVGDHLETFNGTPVAAGGGYIAAPANGGAPGSGESYAFATGPVEVFLGEQRLVGEDINGTLDTSNNDATFRAERFVLAEWDTALQTAALVNWTP